MINSILKNVAPEACVHFYGKISNENVDKRNRWKISGYRYKQVTGLLFYLTHEKGINSRFNFSKQDEYKSFEVFRLYAMSKEEMMEEIKTCKRDDRGRDKYEGYETPRAGV